MLEIPPVGKSGFNDGTIYPPIEGLTGNIPGLALARSSRPAKRLAFRKAAGAKKTTLHCLVLLVDFTDNPRSQSKAHFENLLFNKANPDSMASFYKDLSYGALDITGEVTDWIPARHPYGYYTNGQSGTGNTFPQNTPGLLQEVLQTFCATDNLGRFDLNGDGYVDGLFLVHAGGGAEADPNPAARKDKIWSHKWTLPSPFVNNNVNAYAYFTAPEDGRLGVFSHEFGHFLGLPDLYDTSYRSAGIGDWCLMAGGSWNGAGNRPARMSAWCLAELGWISPTNVKTAGSLTLDPLEMNKKACCRLWTKGKASKEYFLLENRQQSGRDDQLPGKGLAIWHIDDTQSDNTNPYAYKVALIQADGRRDLETSRNQGDASDLFPGSKGVTAVNDKSPTHPHLRSNSGTMTGIGIRNIRQGPTGTISCDAVI
jgi:immune inhibitor A